jgi:hypothetical protein
MPERRSREDKRLLIEIARVIAVCMEVKTALRNVCGEAQAQYDGYIDCVLDRAMRGHDGRAAGGVLSKPEVVC